MSPKNTIKILLLHKCDALRDLVAFVQFKKREKHPWRSVDFSKFDPWNLQTKAEGMKIQGTKILFFKS